MQERNRVIRAVYDSREKKVPFYFIILFYLFRATDIFYEIAKCKLSSSVNFFRSTLRLDTFLSSSHLSSPTVLYACASASVLCKNIFWKQNDYLLNSVYRIITKNLQTNRTWSFDKSFDHAMFLLILYVFFSFHQFALLILIPKLYSFTWWRIIRLFENVSFLQREI